MSKTTIPKINPHSKFGKKTRQFSIRLPEDMIEKIKTEKIDTGRILYDVIELGMDPYGKKMPKLLKKLIQLMIENDIRSPEEYFTKDETKTITDTAEELP